ncbi:one cut domain family member 3 isoform X2 [Anolis carolinensis]|uniref:one cut domain family member 3 isoform X2 n=1 Tax=Anolis carolinensis TaxID=28377 RepID=UPI002F2B34BC
MQCPSPRQGKGRGLGEAARVPYGMGLGAASRRGGPKAGGGGPHWTFAPPSPVPPAPSSCQQAGRLRGRGRLPSLRVFPSRARRGRDGGGLPEAAQGQLQRGGDGGAGGAGAAARAGALRGRARAGLPGAEAQGFTDDPGPSHQPCAEKINLKGEIVVKVVEPEESSEDIAILPPSQEQLPFLGLQNGRPCGKVKAKTKTQPQTDSIEITEEDLLNIQQNQLHVIQSGFQSINHNLRLLQQGMQDLNNSLNVMAHTLVAIKNVYVKNNAGPATFATVTTQTTAGYLSPVSPLAEDRVRLPVAGSNSRSSSCSSSSMSQDPGPSEFPRSSHRPIKKEHPNGCYYFCFADM